MSEVQVGLLVVMVLVSVGLMQLPRLMTLRSKGSEVPDLSSWFPGQAVPQRVLLYFWSPTCAMCGSVTPVINAMIEEGQAALSINAAEHLDLARALHVMGTPSLVLVESGKVGKVVVGAQSEKTIRALL